MRTLLLTTTSELRRLLGDQSDLTLVQESLGTVWSIVFSDITLGLPKVVSVKTFYRMQT